MYDSVSKYLGILIFIAVIILACNDKDIIAVNQTESSHEASPSSTWQQLKCGLWTNASHDLAFEALAFDSETTSHPIYITSFGHEQTVKLNTIIDTNTFHPLGGGYFKDKQHIYEHYDMSDGGYFNLFNADHASFEMIGDCYAKDKDHIYCSRKGIIDDVVDYHSFQSKMGLGCMGKDKNGYYFWDQMMSDEELEDSIVQTIIAQLDHVTQ